MGELRQIQELGCVQQRLRRYWLSGEDAISSRG